jgi:hypothetical protein
MWSAIMRLEFKEPVILAGLLAGAFALSGSFS